LKWFNRLERLLRRELDFPSSNNRRTATVECIEDGRVLTTTSEKLLEIYFQNPQFGYYFLVLTSQRLLENIARIEAIIAQDKIGSRRRQQRPKAETLPG
jgi:CRP-like cAMP-binding protein